MPRVIVYINTHSNVIEQKKDLANIKYLAKIELGGRSGEYRKLTEYDISGGSIDNFLKKIAAINLQELSDSITDSYAVSRVTVGSPRLTSRGIMVSYDRAYEIVNGIQRRKDGLEKNMLFLKLIIE